MSAALEEARQGEADAQKRYTHLKRNLGAIEGIVKSARSPSTTAGNQDRISRWASNLCFFGLAV